MIYTYWAGPSTGSLETRAMSRRPALSKPQSCPRKQFRPGQKCRHCARLWAWGMGVRWGGPEISAVNYRALSTKVIALFSVHGLAPAQCLLACSLAAPAQMAAVTKQLTVTATAPGWVTLLPRGELLPAPRLSRGQAACTIGALCIKQSNVSFWGLTSHPLVPMLLPSHLKKRDSPFSLAETLYTLPAQST